MPLRPLLLLSAAISLHAMSLDESVAYALAHNNTLKQADIAIKSSKTQRDQKEAQRFGRIDLLASYDHYNLPRTLAPLAPTALSVPGASAAVPTTQDLFSTGITYNVTLFDGFARQSAYDISDLQHQMSTIQSQLGRYELIYNVSSLYISLLSLQERLQAQTLFTQAQIKLLERIENEVRLGSKARIDALKAKTSVETSRYQSASLEASIATLKAALSRLMGGQNIGETESIDLMPESQPTDEPINITALQRYKAAGLNLEAKAKKRENTASTYYPKVDLNAYYGLNYGPNEASTTYNNATIIDKGEWNSQEVWQIGAHLKWTLYDFGARSSLNQEARLAILQAQLERDDVELELRKNITTAHNNIALERAKFQSTSAQYRLLQESYKIEQVRYDNHALTLSDLLATSAQKELAHAQMIDARHSAIKANYYLDYLLEKGENR